MVASAEFCDHGYHACMAKPDPPAVETRRSNILAWRERRRLSNYALGKATGMSEGTFRAALDEAKTMLSIPKLELVAAAFNASVEEIINCEKDAGFFADYWALDEKSRAHVRDTARMLAEPVRKQLQIAALAERIPTTVPSADHPSTGSGRAGVRKKRVEKE
jgi:transcriptional regulator with XRE-family HTH domain